MPKYQSFFILASGTEKQLGDYGWIFNSKKNLDADLLKKIVTFLDLEEIENRDGYLKYHSKFLELVLIVENEGFNELFFKVFDLECIASLKEALENLKSDFDFEFEIFDPNFVL